MKKPSHEGWAHLLNIGRTATIKIQFKVVRKMKTWIARPLACIVLTALILVPSSVTAYGLDKGEIFKDIKTYESGTFSDVSEGDWYSAGVQTAYKKGIMGGVGDGSFGAHSTMTWSQAVTIAARLHSAYHGTQIEDSEGVWYNSYVTYAKMERLLPSTCPEGESVDNTAITRQELSGLFRNVLPQEDLPAIDDSSVPDMDVVSKEFRDAVSDMHKAGIFTGKEGGKFDPKGLVTRAEIATIVTRILCPGRRVSHDSRATQAMVKQEGNFFNGGIAVEGENVVYYIFEERITQDLNRGLIIARADTGDLSVVYSASGYLGGLSIGDNGQLYFVENDVLKYLDLSTGNDGSIYRSPFLDGYVLYDGEVYVSECYTRGDDPRLWRYRIGRVQNNELDVLIDGITFSDALNINALHCFDGKVYFMLGHDLWAIDLDTREKALVISGINNSPAAFNGATVFYTREKNDDESYLIRASLAMPEAAETIATIPYTYLIYANGEGLYLHNTGACQLYKVTDSGKAVEYATLHTQFVGDSTVTRQGAILHAVPNLGMLSSQQIDVALPDGSRTTYSEFLRRPYVLEGENLFPYSDAGDFEDIAGLNEGEMSVEPLKIYYTRGNDLVVEVAVYNGEDSDKSISWIQMDLKGEDGLELAQCFMYLGTVKAGDTQIYSLVFPKETVEKVYQIENVTANVEIYYLYNKSNYTF